MDLTDCIFPNQSTACKDQSKISLQGLLDIPTSKLKSKAARALVVILHYGTGDYKSL